MAHPGFASWSGERGRGGRALLSVPASAFALSASRLPVLESIEEETEFCFWGHALPADPIRLSAPAGRSDFETLYITGARQCRAPSGAAAPARSKQFLQSPCLGCFAPLLVARCADRPGGWVSRDWGCAHRLTPASYLREIVLRVLLCVYHRVRRSRAGPSGGTCA